MTQNSLSFKISSQKQKTDLLRYYTTYQSPSNNQHVESLFILPQCRITLYRTQKILFQGAAATVEYQRWQIAPAKTPARPITPNANEMTTYIGCDETGVGDYFAPLVTAACYLDPKIQLQLQQFKIQDSKQLQDSYILEIAPTLRTIIPHIITCLPNEKYNQFVDNGYNAHAIKAFVHNKSIGGLISSTNLPLEIPIVMDEFASRKNYEKYLKNITPTYIPTIFETKAENKYLAVACASLLVRAHFLQLMQSKNETYQTIIPLGAGKQVDAFGLTFLAQHGLSEFKNNVKWHFANTKRIVR